MPFLVFCLILSFIFQFSALHLTPNRALRLLPFVLMELFPLGGIFYYAAVRPSTFLFGWKANIIFCLYIAGAILLGCVLAFLLPRKE